MDQIKLFEFSDNSSFTTSSYAEFTVHHFNRAVTRTRRLGGLIFSRGKFTIHTIDEFHPDKTTLHIRHILQIGLRLSIAQADARPVMPVSFR